MHPSGTNFPRTARPQLWRAVFALSLLAPAGAAAESQILNDTANGPHPVLDWPKDFHIGVTRIEHVACAEGQSKCHEALVIRRVQGVSWRLTAYRIELNYVAAHQGTDPDLIVTARTGGAHCCYTIHVLWTGPKVREQVIPVLDNDETGFLAQPEGPPKLRFGDFNFAYWRASFADSPAPSVILHFDSATMRYEVDVEAMRAAPPDEAALAGMASEIRKAESDLPIGDKPPAPLLWSHMLDLIYSGNADSARRLLDLAWPAGRGGKDEFVACFTAKLNAGDWWRVAKLSKKLGADAVFPAAAGTACPKRER